MIFKKISVFDFLKFYTKKDVEHKSFRFPHGINEVGENINPIKIF